VTGLVPIFRAHSDAEARVVAALLEAHGIRAASAPAGGAVFPVAFESPAEIAILVHGDHADEARAIIEAHQDRMAREPARPLGEELRPLQEALGYAFRDVGLLEHALTHTSRAHEDVSGGVADNESLEFLGDAVLGFIVAELLFRAFPQFSEGEKSKAKATLVSTATLAKLATDVSLGRYVLLGRGEEKTGGRLKPALLADAFEAVIAAIFLDGGIDEARAFVTRQLAPAVAALGEAGVGLHDHKSALQEFLQSRGRPLPAYRLAGTTGPDHQKRFAVTVSVGGEVVAEGHGGSKKDAEQDAARQAIGQLKDQ
jgi:ribonuclease III